MLSKTSKLGCFSWSLQAWDTCPGARGDDGEAVDACKFCYARRGNYVYPNVKRVREVNLEDWKKDDWVERMDQNYISDGLILAIVIIGILLSRFAK
jgi:hypothetical protein